MFTKAPLALIAMLAVAACTPAGNSLYHGVWGFHLNQVDGKPCALGFNAGVGMAADEKPAPVEYVAVPAPMRSTTTHRRTSTPETTDK